jgi:hypothetical protein
LAQWEQFGKRRNKEEERKNGQNERKDLTLTGLLMEGVEPDPYELSYMQRSGQTSKTVSFEIGPGVDYGYHSYRATEL